MFRCVVRASERGIGSGNTTARPNTRSRALVAKPFHALFVSFLLNTRARSHNQTENAQKVSDYTNIVRFSHLFAAHQQATRIFKALCGIELRLSLSRCNRCLTPSLSPPTVCCQSFIRSSACGGGWVRVAETHTASYKHSNVRCNVIVASLYSVS